MPYAFSFRRYRLPFRAPVRTAHGVWTAREGLIVRVVETANGSVGFGEAAPIPWFGTETVDAAEAIAKKIGDRIEREKLQHIPSDAPCLRAAVHAALDFADAKQRENSTDSAPPIAGADYLPVAGLLPAGKAARQKLRELSEAGFRTFKWKVGVLDARDESVLLDELLSDLPPGARLRLDANGAWNRKTAEQWLDRAAERPIEFVEQPIAADARGAEDLLLGLAHDFPTPIALDESTATGAQVERWLDLGWPGWFVIKPLLLADASATLAKLRARRAEIVFSSALETAIGARHALKLALHHAPSGRAVGFGVWPLFEDARFDGPQVAPFIRSGDVDTLNPEALWNALS